MESGASNSWAGYILPLCDLFGIQPEELLKADHIVINNNNTSCQYSGGYVINQISDKLIEQYEKRLLEKDSLIDYLQKEIQQLKTENKGQWAVVSNSKLKTQNSEPSCIIPKKAVPLWL